MNAIEKYNEFNKGIPDSRKEQLIKLANNSLRSQYDRTKEWKTRRALRIEGANYKCEQCSGIKDLDAHHLNYDNFGNEQYEDLKILCKNCHKKFHMYHPCYDHIAFNSNKKSIKEQIELDLINS